jgi:hypothetical protein
MRKGNVGVGVHRMGKENMGMGMGVWGGKENMGVSVGMGG